MFLRFHVSTIPQFHDSDKRHCPTAETPAEGAQAELSFPPGGTETRGVTFERKATG